jgi:hypothetical protein
MASEGWGPMNLVAEGAIGSKLNEILGNPNYAVTNMHKWIDTR